MFSICDYVCTLQHCLLFRTELAILKPLSVLAAEDKTLTGATLARQLVGDMCTFRYLCFRVIAIRALFFA